MSALEPGPPFAEPSQAPGLSAPGQSFHQPHTCCSGPFGVPPVSPCPSVMAYPRASEFSLLCTGLHTQVLTGRLLDRLPTHWAPVLLTGASSPPFMACLAGLHFSCIPPPAVGSVAARGLPPPVPCVYGSLLCNCHAPHSG